MSRNADGSMTFSRDEVSRIFDALKIAQKKYSNDLNEVTHGNYAPMGGRSFDDDGTEVTNFKNKCAMNADACLIINAKISGLFKGYATAPVESFDSHMVVALMGFAERVARFAVDGEYYDHDGELVQYKADIDDNMAAFTSTIHDARKLTRINESIEVCTCPRRACPACQKKKPAKS